jgi:enoyl-[acyl-carrier-protein] reductase (NADH)
MVLTPLVEQALSGIAPGVDTQAAFSSVCNENFLRREITALDIANAVLFLASEEARNITSHWLAVSSAQHKKTPAPEPYFTV